MSDDALRRPLPPSVFARLTDATRYVITGVSPDTWFGPLQPLAPMAPPEVKGRQWDYPFGANLNYVPRSDDSISFGELRALADALPLLRAVIETRKDQLAAQSFAIRARNREDSPASSQAIDQVTRFLARPDRRRSFADWLRVLLEEMIERDASDLHISAGERPKLRIDGEITNSGNDTVMTPKDTLTLAYSVLTENQK